MRNVIKNYFLEEDAIGVVEIILILVILIALVLIFKTKINSVVTKAFTNFTRDTGKILAQADGLHHGVSLVGFSLGFCLVWHTVGNGTLYGM